MAAAACAGAVLLGNAVQLASKQRNWSNISNENIHEETTLVQLDWTKFLNS